MTKNHRIELGPKRRLLRNRKKGSIFLARLLRALIKATSVRPPEAAAAGDIEPENPVSVVPQRQEAGIRGETNKFACLNPGCNDHMLSSASVRLEDSPVLLLWCESCGEQLLASEWLRRYTGTRLKDPLPDSVQNAPRLIVKERDLAGSESSAIVGFAARCPEVKVSHIEAGEIDLAFRDKKGKIDLVAGSVEFVRKAMAALGIQEPQSLSYPASLAPWLRRRLELRSAQEVREMSHTIFVKPAETKVFNGFVTNRQSMAETDAEACQRSILESMPAEALVWVSEPVFWTSEFRFYIFKNKVIGGARYDAGYHTSIPSMEEVNSMVRAYSPYSPIAYALDVGVTSKGETALIECNDFWAIGLYPGAISESNYVEMLVARWAEMQAGAPAVTQTKEEVNKLFALAYCKRTLETQGFVSAVRAYREMTGANLADAKEALLTIKTEGKK